MKTSSDPRVVLTKLRMFAEHSGPEEIVLTREEVQAFRRLFSRVLSLASNEVPEFWDKYETLCREITEEAEFRKEV